MVWSKRRAEWRAYCQQKVEYHERLAMSWHHHSDGHARTVEEETLVAADTSATEKRRRFARYLLKSHGRGAKYLGTVAKYHDQMSAKWSEAASSLWLSAEPDPPEP
jgi:uncharacterized protein YndB with AHSA1/START domain